MTVGKNRLTNPLSEHIQPETHRPTLPASQTHDPAADATRSDRLDSQTPAWSEWLPRIEAALEDACEMGEGCPAVLGDAIRYALLAPGKRLRPALVLMAAEACGGSIDDAMPGAVAVEMIHAYSLIHDDLPAMDDDDLRRGRPTVHIEFDEATAILAGDSLQPLAFEQISGNVPDPHRAREAIRVLSSAAGPRHLVGGQSDDLSAESQSAESLDRREALAFLESIHRRKTGALFAASLDLGAVLVGATAEQRNILRGYASDVGLAFQVVDDLLDHTADEDQMGKRVGKDIERGKLTYPRLMGVGKARERAEQLIRSARSHVHPLGQSAWRLNHLAQFVLDRQK